MLNFSERTSAVNIVEKELTSKPGIERINAIIFGLETSTLISYVLFILRNVADAQTRDELFETIESYINASNGSSCEYKRLQFAFHRQTHIKIKF